MTTTTMTTTATSTSKSQTYTIEISNDSVTISTIVDSKKYVNRNVLTPESTLRQLNKYIAICLSDLDIFIDLSTFDNTEKALQ